MTLGKTRIACAVGMSAFASGTLAANCCRAACDVLASSAAAVWPLSWAMDGLAAQMSKPPTSMPANHLVVMSAFLSCVLLPARGFIEHRDAIR